jgi:hypothetical protein
VGSIPTLGTHSKRLTESHFQPHPPKYRDFARCFQILAKNMKDFGFLFDAENGVDSESKFMNYAD